MRCEDCAVYRALNDSEGECMLAPPIRDVKMNITARSADAWVRPVVFFDDFCNDFSEKKIVESKKPARGRPSNKTRKNALHPDNY
jgi:hypothetical protein